MHAYHIEQGSAVGICMLIHLYEYVKKKKTMGGLWTSRRDVKKGEKMTKLYFNEKILKSLKKMSQSFQRKFAGVMAMFCVLTVQVASGAHVSELTELHIQLFLF